MVAILSGTVLRVDVIMRPAGCFPDCVHTSICFDIACRYYFAVSNMEAGLEYKFNLVNLVKPDSLYNAGMRPAFYSICDAGKGMGWRRVGERIAYYENHFETENGSSYYTLTFSLSFPHTNDVCYLAHCFPYSYSDMSACLAVRVSLCWLRTCCELWP